VTKVLGPIWVPLTAYRWHGGGRELWPSWLQSYSMNGFPPMIERKTADGQPRLRVHNGYEMQFASSGDWIVLDAHAAQVYTDLAFRRKYPHRRIFREKVTGAIR
jgi:hypothetical protein